MFQRSCRFDIGQDRRIKMTDCKFDIVIIGTGPSSYFFLHSLMQSRPNLNICVLEAGYVKKRTAVNSFQMSPLELDFKLYPTTYVGYGGTSRLWHNVFAPLDPIDFRARKWVPHSGWPICFEEIFKYYVHVSNVLNLDYHLFYKKNLPRHVHHLIGESQFDKRIFEPKVFLWPKKYFRSNEYFDHLIKKHYKRIKLKFGFLVQEIIGTRSSSNEFVSSGVVGIDLKTGRTKKIESDIVILCAGGLYTPRILLNTNCSFRGQNNIGKYLLDHPMGNLFKIRYQNSVSRQIYRNYPIKKTLGIKVGLRLREDAQKDMEMLNSAFYMKASFHEGMDDITEKSKENLKSFKRKVLSLRPPHRETSFLIKYAAVVGNSIMYRLNCKKSYVLSDTMFMAEQIPSPHSFVSLSAQKDSWGYKKIDYNWNIGPEEEAYMYKYYELIKDYVARPNKAKMVLEKNDISWRDRLTSAAHHLGTCRMGDSPLNAVVDKNNKVFGTQNVFICDGSIFPTSGNANPTLTIMALAYRLGDQIGKKI